MRREERLRDRLVRVIFFLFSLLLIVSGMTIYSLIKSNMVSLDQIRALGDLRLINMYLDIRAPGYWDVRDGQLYKGSLQITDNWAMSYDLTLYLPLGSEIDFEIGSSSEYETAKYQRAHEYNIFMHWIIEFVRRDPRFRHMLSRRGNAPEDESPAALLSSAERAADSTYLTSDGLLTKLFRPDGEIAGWMHIKVSTFDRGEFERRIFIIFFMAFFILFSVILAFLYIVLYRLAQPIKRLEDSHATILREKKSLEDLSRSDPLTKLLNRRGFEKAMSVVCQSWGGAPYALAMLDLDDFKIVNDTYGHACGDLVLVRVAALIRKNVRRQDLTCRWGGEEFLVCYPDASAQVVAEAAERLRAAIAAYPMAFENNKIHVTVTIGTAICHGKADFDGTLSRADAALYRGKRSGKNVVVSGEESGPGDRP